MYVILFHQVLWIKHVFLLNSCMLIFEYYIKIIYFFCI